VFSHALPAPALIHYPRAGAVDVPASKLLVSWTPDRSASRYRVSLEQGENDGLTVELPAGSHSFQVPDGVLARNTETQLEIAAIGRNGNRTLVEVPFTTR
jgi:hypothetical protein